MFIPNYSAQHSNLTYYIERLSTGATGKIAAQMRFGSAQMHFCIAQVGLSGIKTR